MQLKKVLDVEPKENVFVSTTVKKVTLLEAKIVQPEVASAKSVGNAAIMLAVAKGEGTQSLENKAPPNNGKADSSVMVMGDRPIKTRIIVAKKVRMTSFAFTIEEHTCAMSNSIEPVISVNIGGISRDVLVDSGSTSNLISKDTLQKRKCQGLKVELKPSTKRLYAYGGRELRVEAQFQSEVSVLKSKVVTNFIVVESRRCFLGYSTVTNLGIL